MKIAVDARTLGSRPSGVGMYLNDFLKVLMKYREFEFVLLSDVAESEYIRYFMEKGIARAYAPINGEEVTFWFGGEGAALVSLKSYVNDEPGYETVELIEDASLYVLRREKLYELFEKDLHIANWGRKFAETELVKAEKKIISLLFLDASERYKELLENTPELLQRIPLGNIASYLGITQVSLSRIRAKIK